GGRGLLVKHRGLLGGQERTCAELLPRDRGVLDRYEVGVAAERALCGEPEHLRPECRESTGYLDLRSDVWGGVHRVEIPAHVLERMRVGLSPRLDGRSVTHAEPEEEPAGVGVDERARAVRHSDGIARPDVGDACRNDEVLRRAEQKARVCEGLLTAEAFRYPERLEP